MPYQSPGRCPACESGLQIGRLVCPDCGTSIEGRFELCMFCKLGKEHRSFAEVFLKCRGNIREVEKELGISYPTVRNRLEALLAAMGYMSEHTKDISGYVKNAQTSLDILSSLDSGGISFDDALKSLQQIDSKAKR